MACITVTVTALPANMVAGTYSVTPLTVQVGGSFTASQIINNTGGSSGTATVTFSAGGTPVVQTFAIAAGGTHTFTQTFTASTAGTVSVCSTLS